MLKTKELNSICPYECYCGLQPTKINGVELDYNDFGDNYDI